MNATKRAEMPADMLTWIQQHIAHAWDQTCAPIPPTHDAVVDACVKTMQTEGVQPAWAGMVHNGALELITEITGLHAHAARTVAINIQTHINDTIVKIYQHARDAKRPPAPRPPNYTLEEQEQQLDALDLLLTGAETLQEYRRSHIKRRRNTVAKRMRERGEGVDHLPPVGTALRTYAAGQCIKSTIKNYNTTNNTCSIAIDDSNLTLTTSVRKVSRSAVRKNGLTADETELINHEIERLTDNTITSTESWKPYGTVARVTCDDGAPTVVIVRKDDAVVEHQPLVDVIDADIMRTGKRVLGKTSRGRTRSRDTSKTQKAVRGGAPRRTQRLNFTKPTRGSPPGLNIRGGTSPTYRHNRLDSRQQPGGTQGPLQVGKSQPHGPDDRGGTSGRYDAHSGGASLVLPGGPLRQPATRVAMGVQRGMLWQRTIDHDGRACTGPAQMRF